MMKTITDKGKTYTFKDEYTVNDWMMMEEVEGDTAKMAQIRMLASLSIEPKLTFDDFKSKSFRFMNKVMAEMSDVILGED